MKKRIALLLATVMVLGMTACGGKTEQPAEAPAEAPAATEEEAGETEGEAQPAASGDTIKVAFICESLQNASLWRLSAATVTCPAAEPCALTESLP